MAEEKKSESKKKAKPRRIVSTRHDDGSYSHEHYHDGKAEPHFAGTSQSLADLQQHMADNTQFAEPAAGGGAAAGEPAAGGGGGEPEPGGAE